MDNINNDVMQQLAQAYMNMLAESHTHEQLMKLSVEKLKELKAEYVKKIGEAEGEEKEKHQKELANIEDILASRKDDKDDKEEVEEAYRLTPEREKILDKADADAQIALDKSIGSANKDEALKALGKSTRAEILRQLSKPKKTGAWAGSSDDDLKSTLNYARKSQLGESAKEIVQNISEWMKNMKGKKNGKSK
jgi:DNA-binding transcriptional ArsR family regulator